MSKRETERRRDEDTVRERRAGWRELPRSQRARERERMRERVGERARERENERARERVGERPMEREPTEYSRKHPRRRRTRRYDKVQGKTRRPKANDGWNTSSSAESYSHSCMLLIIFIPFRIVSYGEHAVQKEPERAGGVLRARGTVSKRLSHLFSSLPPPPFLSLTDSSLSCP